jgi:hypothetical protein
MTECCQDARLRRMALRGLEVALDGLKDSGDLGVSAFGSSVVPPPSAVAVFVWNTRQARVGLICRTYAGSHDLRSVEVQDDLSIKHLDGASPLWILRYLARGGALF